MTTRRIRRGDVVLLAFPCTDLTGARVRPALVVAGPTGRDIVVASITAQTVRIDPRAEHLLDQADAEFRQTGLKVSSLIRTNKLATLREDFARRRLGRIGHRTEHAVVRCLRYLFRL